MTNKNTELTKLLESQIPTDTTQTSNKDSNENVVNDGSTINLLQQALSVQPSCPGPVDIKTGKFFSFGEL